MSPIPVIIDTDPGVDDTVAILLALASPELEIKAITINFGNTDADNSYTNVLKIWKALEDNCKANPQEANRFFTIGTNFKRDFPILAMGSRKPLDGESMYAQYFHGRDGLSDISGRHPELSIPTGWKPSTLELTDRSAVDVSLDIIRKCPPKSVTYIVLGPMTNLAHILRKDAACFQERIGRVVIMGGTLDAPGNTTAVAEFNFFADPYAVKEVLHPQGATDGIPLDRTILLSLDHTSKIGLPFQVYKAQVDPQFEDTKSPSKAEGKSPLVHFTSSFFERTVEVMAGFGADVVELHDPTAVWCAICNPPALGETSNGPNMTEGWKTKKRIFQIERYGEYTRGMLVVDRREDESNYKVGANRAEEFALANSVTVDPPIQVETGEQVGEALMEGVEGVPVVVESPGAKVAIKFLLERIWGVSLI